MWQISMQHTYQLGSPTQICFSLRFVSRARYSPGGVVPCCTHGIVDLDPCCYPHPHDPRWFNHGKSSHPVTALKRCRFLAAWHSWRLWTCRITRSKNWCLEIGIWDDCDGVSSKGEKWYEVISCDPQNEVLKASTCFNHHKYGDTVDRTDNWWLMISSGVMKLPVLVTTYSRAHYEPWLEVKPRGSKIFSEDLSNEWVKQNHGNWNNLFM